MYIVTINDKQTDMKSLILTIFFFAAIASAKCETPATETTKTDVKTEKTAQPATETPATAADKKDTTKGNIFVGTSELYLNLIREGIKRA